MRFYIGTSYKLKTKVIIKFLIALGFLVLAVLGLDRANAWTFVNTNENSATAIKSIFSGFSSVGANYYSGTSQYVSYTCEFATDQYCGIYMDTDRYATMRYWFKKSSGASSYPTYLTNSYTIALNENYPSNPSIAESVKGATQHDIYYLKNNNNICSSDSNNKSVDFQGSFAYNGDLSTISNYNSNYSTSNTFVMSIMSFDTTNDVQYTTPCEVVYNTNSSGYYYYSFICENVPISTSSNTYDKYGIVISNFLRSEDQFKGSGTSAINGALMLNVGTWNLNSYNALQYECSSSDPIVEGGHDNTIYSTDNTYNDAKDNYDDSIGGIPTDNILLQYPDSFADIVALPINLITAFSNASDTCSPYTIDLSSLSTEWGGSNYTLTLPCMRTYVSNIIGSNYYQLFDLLLSAIVFYKIATSMIVYVEAVTSGDDLFDLFFKGEHSSVLDKKEK